MVQITTHNFKEFLNSFGLKGGVDFLDGSAKRRAGDNYVAYRKTDGKNGFEIVFGDGAQEVALMGTHKIGCDAKEGFAADMDFTCVQTRYVADGTLGTEIKIEDNTRSNRDIVAAIQKAAQNFSKILSEGMLGFSLEEAGIKGASDDMDQAITGLGNGAKASGETPRIAKSFIHGAMATPRPAPQPAHSLR